MKAENTDESVKELPSEISSDLMMNLTQFVNNHDSDDIIINIKNELDQLTSEIDIFKAEQKVKTSAMKKHKVANQEANEQKPAKKTKKINTDSDGKDSE